MLNRTTHVGRRRGAAPSIRRELRDLVTRSGAVKGVALVGLVGSVGAALVIPAANAGQAVRATSASAFVQPEQALGATAAQLTVTRETLGRAASRDLVRESLGEATSGRAANAAVVAPVAPTVVLRPGLSGIKAVPNEVPAAESADGGQGGVFSAVPGGMDTASFAGAGAALGLSPNGQRVYSAVRAAFGLTNIGGYRAGDWGDHGTGHAADIMVSNFATGDAVAAFVMANAASLGVKYVIWKQAIWFPGSSGWRGMEDRGSPTQNHYDHVHVSVN